MGMNDLSLTELMALDYLVTAEIDRINVQISLNVIYNTVHENIKLQETKKKLETIEQKLFVIEKNRVTAEK